MSVVDRRDERTRRAGSRDLLDHDARRERVASLATELLGYVDGVEPGIAQRLVDVPRELARLVDLGGPGGDLVDDEVPDGLAQRDVLRAQGEFWEVRVSRHGRLLPLRDGWPDRGIN